jgi:two-component system CheB/CheR fusion protein
LPRQSNDPGDLEPTPTSQELTALRQSEERLRLMIESIEAYAIVSMDSEGRIDSWNAGGERTFGYSANAILGTHIDILFTPQDRDQQAAQVEMWAARDTGRATDFRADPDRNK